MNSDSLAKHIAEARSKRGWLNNQSNVSDLSPAAADTVAETEAREITCPSCGHTWSEDYKTDDVTSETGESDEDNDGDDIAEFDDRANKLAREIGKAAAKYAPNAAERLEAIINEFHNRS